MILFCLDFVPAVFRWEHGGRNVYITGTFNNWDKQVWMYGCDDVCTALLFFLSFLAMFSISFKSNCISLCYLCLSL